MKKLAVLALSIVASVSLGLTAPSAFAHAPAVSGLSVCSDGVKTINWTLHNSETVAGTNRTMTIFSETVTKGALPLPIGTVVQPNGATSTDAHPATTYVAADTGSVTWNVVVNFSGGGPQNVAGSATVALVEGCIPVTTTTLPPVTTTIPPVTTTVKPIVTTVPTTVPTVIPVVPTIPVTTTSTTTTVPTVVVGPGEQRIPLATTGSSSAGGLAFGLLFLITGWLVVTSAAPKRSAYRTDFSE